MSALETQPPFFLGRPPRGGRGLKYREDTDTPTPSQSPPSRGAWIEIDMVLFVKRTAQSPPSRGAWIEIDMVCSVSFRKDVAPLAGGVD